MADSDILARLSSFIDYESPELAEFVYRMIEDQGNAITYRELRQAILDGGLSLDYLRQWQQDYSRFINEAYSQAVERAVAQAAADLRLEYGVNFYDPMFSKIDNFIQTHGGQLIRQVSIEQYTAINQLVRQATLTTSMTVDQLARVIRPCVGLTRRQAQTTKNFYDSLIKDGYSDKRARERQLVYAAKIHRQRAAMIAETEIATAYNAGWQATIQQNVEDGILPPGTRKQWLTAEDEKVCPICGGMREETVLWNEPFSNGSDYPPAHPRCRCHYKIIFVDLLQQPEYATDPYANEDMMSTQEEAEEIEETVTATGGTEPQTEETGPAYTSPDDYDAEIERIREQRRALWDADTFDKEEDDRLLQMSLDLQNQKADFTAAYNLSDGDIRLTNMLRSGDAQQVGNAVNEVLDGMGLKASKWSGIIKTASADALDAAGRKEWNCDITIREDFIKDLKVSIHENLHSRSASYFSPQVYLQNRPTEEGAVELMAQQICERRGVPYAPSYPEYVNPLKEARTILYPKMSEYDYAKKLLDIDEDKRYSYIGKQIQEYADAHPKMRSGTRRKLNDILKALQG